MRGSGTGSARAAGAAVLTGAAIVSSILMTSPASASTSLTKCYTFNGRASADFTKVCTSDHGNISKFESPKGHEHIRAGYFGEGYALCSNGGATVHGWDAMQDESPWGQTTLSAGTITRRTADGALQIAQTFKFDGPNARMAITMTVKNLGATRSGVVLSRYFDGDIDGTPNEFGATTSASVFEWQPKPGHGLSMTATSFSTAHDPFVETFGNWFTTSKAGCNPIPESTPAGPTDLTGRINYQLGTLAHNAVKTVIYTYGRL